MSTLRAVVVLLLALGLPALPVRAANVPASQTADSGTQTASPDPASQLKSCSCHDHLAPAEPNAPRVDARGWAADGPHRALGCTSCHPAAATVPHTAAAAGKPDCARCHEAQAKDWKDTVHGRAEGRDPRIDGCQTCHAEHAILEGESPKARYFNTGLLHSCASCHAPMTLRPRFDPPVKPAPADKPWPSSFHGLVAQGDQRAVARCESCHGAHQIFPSSDPRSDVSHDRVESTCGACHDGITSDIAHTGVKNPLPGPLSQYFDVWYLWGGGTVALTLLGIAGAFAAGAIFRRK